MALTFDEIVEKLGKRFPEKIESCVQFGTRFVSTDEDTLYDLLTVLKEDFDCTYIVDVVASHWPMREHKFEVAYNLFSIEHNLRIIAKAPLKENRVKSATDIWKGANFLEREQYDLVGVVFEGHPDLRRILLPEFFEGHPLRKDYELKDRAWFNAADEQNLGIRFTK